MHKILTNGRLLPLSLWALASLLVCLSSIHAVSAQATNPTPAPVITPGPIPNSITNAYQRRINPSPLIVGQDATASIRLAGSSNPACRGIPGKPVDLMLVYDISASAGIGPGSNWETTALLTQSLLDYAGRPIYQTPTGSPEFSRIGVISSRIGTFGVEPVLIQPLTEDFNLLRSQVAAISPGDDTNMAAGLQLASEELAKAQAANREQAIVLMLHDNAGFLEMETAVATLRAQGTPVYIIINSLNIPVGSQLERATARQLTDSDRIFIDPAPEELYPLFLSATGGNDDTAAAVIRVVEELTPVNAAQIFNVRGAGGRIDGSRVIWDIARLEFGSSLNLTYQFRLPGQDAIGINGGMVWLDCNGYPHSTLLGVPVGQTSMVEITITPELVSAQPDSGQPVPTATPTPDSGAGVTIPGGGVVVPGGDLTEGGLFNDLTWWWLLLIPLLLLLLWLFWRWQQGRKPKPGPIDRPGGRPEPNPPPQPVTRVTRVKPPTGQDVAHGWTTESLTDKYGRSLTLRYQSSMDEQGRLQMIARIDDEKQTIGRAAIHLNKVTVQDDRTGRMTETTQACLHEWNIQNPRDYRMGIGDRLLAKLEQWVKDQQVTTLAIPDGLIDDVNLLSSHGYKKQGAEWVKPLLSKGE